MNVLLIIVKIKILDRKRRRKSPTLLHGYPKDDPTRLASSSSQRGFYTWASKKYSDYFTEDCFLANMFEKITENLRHFRKKSAIENRRSADYFLLQGSDGQESTTHSHAHQHDQAERKNMLNIIDQILL